MQRDLMRHFALFFLVMYCSLACSSRAFADLAFIEPGRPFVAKSPNDQLRLHVDVVGGKPVYWVTGRAASGDRREIIRPSAFGLQIDGKPAWPRDPRGFEICWAGYSPAPEMRPVFEKCSSPGRPFFSYTLEFPSYPSHGVAYLGMEAEFRVYDDAIAIKYCVRARGSSEPLPELQVTADLTEFRFADDCLAWSYNGEHTPKGPTKLSEVKGKIRMPVTLKASDDCYVALLQAAIYDWDIAELAKLDDCFTGLTASIKPCGKTEDDSRDIRTPWLVIQVADSPGALLESNVMVNLNPPCAIEDPSWIEPGLAMWDWRCIGATTDDGFTYDADMATWKRMVDFAGENNIRYLLLDANWYGDEFNANSNPMTPKSGADIPNLIQYAKQQNVGVILYFNHAATKNFDFDKTLETYASWGAAGLKYGFLRGYEGRAKVRITREIIEKCAKHRLLVDFHDGPIPPSGDRRTWPNVLGREFCHAQSDAKRSFGPTCFTTTVFVNMLAGPLDMTNGLYDINRACKQRPKVFQEVYTTVAGETARVFITFSGLNILHDAGDAYAKKADLFEFIRSLPPTWDETRILHGEIGQFITTARRGGNQWFIASATNEDARTLPITLDFLDEGKEYDATLYQDAPDTHYKTNREAYEVQKTTVRKGNVIPAKMAPGGGHSIWVRPKK